MGTEKAKVQPVIVRLGPSHDRSSFDCGSEPLNRYLRTQATQDLRRSIAIPYLSLVDDIVAGYFTLSAASIDIGDLPERLRKKLPGGAIIGASLLGRLAVDRAYQGQGIGEFMLTAAIDYSFQRSPLACVAMIVDAINPAAAAFYERYGFRILPDGPRRLFLLRESLAKHL